MSNIQEELVNESLSMPKIPKKLKHKFIKDLNHKSNFHLKTFSMNDHFVIDSKKKDMSQNKLESKQNTIQSLFQDAIKGARIIKG